MSRRRQLYGLRRSRPRKRMSKQKALLERITSLMYGQHEHLLARGKEAALGAQLTDILHLTQLLLKLSLRMRTGRRSGNPGRDHCPGAGRRFATAPSFPPSRTTFLNCTACTTLKTPRSTI